MIHFWDGVARHTPCKIEILKVEFALGSPEWSEVTCAACKVSEPAVGVELPALLAECESAMTRLRAGIAALEQEYAHAESLRDHVRSQLSATLSQDQGSEVGQGRVYPIWKSQGISEAEWERGRAQFDRLLGEPMRELRRYSTMGLREAKAAAIDMAHGEALRMERRASSMRKISPQDFLDGLAGYAERQRRWSGGAPWYA